MSRANRWLAYMETARVFAQRSTCTRAKVGAVIVKDRHIISTGYNGAPPGQPHCIDVGCEELILFTPQKVEVNLGCQRCVHAEANAIAWAARSGTPTQGAVMYCTHSPCRKCLELMASAGITGFVYKETYRDTPWALVSSLGIQHTQYDQPVRRVGL